MMLIKSKLGNSSIHGIGLFACEFVPKGTLVWKFDSNFDVVLTQEYMSTLPEAALEQFKNYAYKSLTTGNYILCSDDARFINHDLNSNTVCSVPPDLDEQEALVCHAVRDIQVGEEITNNYLEFDSDPHDVM